MNDGEYREVYRQTNYEGSPVDQLWLKYWELCYMELQTDGMEKELEGFIDIGFESHILDEWVLRPGLPFDFPDELYIVPEEGLTGIDVMLLYYRIGDEYKNDIDKHPEENRIVTKKRILLKTRLIRNMNAANGFMYKNKGNDLMTEIIKAESQGL